MDSLLSLVQWCSMLALLTAAGASEPVAAPQRSPSEVTASARVTIKPADLSAEITSAPATNPSGRVRTGKPWLDDFAAYSNSRNSRVTRGHVVGQSRQISFSFGEAHRRANVDAARQVYDRLRPRLRPWMRDGDDREWILESIAQELAGGKSVLDAYSSWAHKYGEVIWSHAILVDASDDRLRMMADRYNGAMRERKANFARTSASVVGLVILICVTYGLVNAWTKGYLRGQLRAAAVLAMVGGAWVLIRLADLGT